MTKPGLSDTSKESEMIVNVDDKTAIRYRVAEEVIDLSQLRQDKEALENTLSAEEPSLAELAEWGRSSHPYYAHNEQQTTAKLAEIDDILKVWQ